MPALLAGCSLLFAGGSAFAADDSSFIKSAYQDGLAEVKLGQMGESKTANPEVKAFATEMVTDHGAANTELKSLADSKKVEVASDPSLMEQGKAKLLDTKTGGDFDKAFVSKMVSDHKSAVAAFEKAANEAKDSDVKALAAKLLPTLKSHLSMAESLQDKLGK
jgi:putative membrane protein